jgi:hypothetical protein
LSRLGRHSALSVRRIEAADRKRGGQICLEFPPISLSLSLSLSLARSCPLAHAHPSLRLPVRHPLKLTIQASPRVLDCGSETPVTGEEGRAAAACHPRYLPNIKYPLGRPELGIACPLFAVPLAPIFIVSTRARAYNWCVLHACRRGCFAGLMFGKIAGLTRLH